MRQIARTLDGMKSHRQKKKICLRFHFDIIQYLIAFIILGPLVFSPSATLGYYVNQIFPLSSTQGTLTVTAVDDLERGFKKITLEENGPGYQAGGYSGAKVVAPNGQFIDGYGYIVGTDLITAPYQSGSLSGYQQALFNLKDTNQPLLQQQYREQYGIPMVAPSPKLFVSKPNEVSLGDWLEITLTVRNDGGMAGLGLVRIIFFANEADSYVQFPGYNFNNAATATVVPNAYQGRDVLLVGGQNGPQGSWKWNQGESISMKVRVRPLKVGKLSFFSSITANTFVPGAGFGPSYSDPANVYPGREDYVFVNASQSPNPPPPPPQLTLFVTPDGQNVPAKAGMATFNISSPGQTIDWPPSITSGSSWLSIAGGDYGANNNATLTVAYTANSETFPRVGTIVITAFGATESPKTVKIVQDASVPSPSIPKPTAIIRASSPNIPSNSPVTISWTSTDATSCTVSPTGWIGTNSYQTETLTASKTYVLNCSGAGGSIQESMTVDVAPQTPILTSMNFAVSGMTLSTFLLSKIEDVISGGLDASFSDEEIKEVNSLWETIKKHPFKSLLINPLKNPFKTLWKTLVLKIKTSKANEKIETLLGEESKTLAGKLSQRKDFESLPIPSFTPIPWSRELFDCNDQYAAEWQFAAKIMNEYQKDNKTNINIVAHSHAAVITYNTLKWLEKNKPAIKINKFITLGTIIEPGSYIPIINPRDSRCLFDGQFTIDQSIQSIAPEQFTWPKNVTNWINVYSDEDDLLSKEVNIVGVENIKWTLPRSNSHLEYYENENIRRLIFQCVRGGECSSKTLKEPPSEPIIIPIPPGTSCEQNLGVKCSAIPTDLFTADLYHGIKNDRVMALQKFLQKQGFFPAGISITNNFGKITKQAVQKFQAYYSIVPSAGYVGSLTRAKLNALLVPR